MPLISICIPAYKRVHYLKRLLDSISVQTFRDFEVVITDDSPDDIIEKLIVTYCQKFTIVYHHNPQAKGTPANWNEGISRANGEWIKLMHDDDWFAQPNSLAIFAEHTKNGKKFIFSAYANRANMDAAEEVKRLQPFWKKRIINEPMTLLAYNVVGPPSVTLIHKSIKEKYDEKMKWRVDMDFYVRLLLQEKEYTYIDEPLIYVGISDTQVTNYCFQYPSVELPEGYLLLKKYGANRLQNIWVYDAWWRLLRNMNIKTPEQLLQYEPQPWPAAIITLLLHLNRIPTVFLNAGIFSKTAMAISYFFNQSKATR